MAENRTEEVGELLVALASSELDNVSEDEINTKVTDMISLMGESSARANLVGEVGSGGKVFQECSSYSSYKRVVSVLTSAIALEAGSEFAEHVDALAAGLCFLLSQNSLAEEDTQNLSEEAKSNLSQLVASEKDASAAKTKDAFLSVAYKNVEESNQGCFVPALILATACSQAQSDLTEDDAANFRSDLLNLLGRRLFSTTMPSTAREVRLCGPLLQGLTKEEFDSAIVRPLKFNLASKPGAAMEALVALVQYLVQQGKNDYLRSYLAGPSNIVASATAQLTASEAAYSAAAAELLLAIVHAFPNEGAQLVSKSLVSALQQNPAEPLYSSLQQVGTAMLQLKGTEHGDDYSSLAENDVLPALQQGNQQDAAAALSVWANLQQTVSPPPATKPGVQHIGKDDAVRLDDRIAAKMKNAPPAVAQSSKESQRRKERVNAKAAAVAGGAAAVGATAVASRDANIKAQARGTAAPATAPGAQPGKSAQVDTLDERIRQKTNMANKSTTPQDALDERIRQKTGMANKNTTPQDEVVDIKTTDILSDRKTVVIASHQQVSAGKDLPALDIKEEIIDDPGKTTSDKFEGSFENEGYTKTEDDDVDTNSQLSDHPGGIEVGDGGPGLVEAVAVDPESDDEYIPAAVEFDPDDKGKSVVYLKDSRTRKYGIAAVCILVALVVGLSVGLTRTNVEVEVTDSPSMTPSAAPTSVLFSEVSNFIITSFEGLMDDMDSLLDDDTSPQAQALDWLFTVDTFFGSDNGRQLLENIDENRLLQRYVLAVFAFATESKFWSFCGFPTDNTGLCLVDLFDPSQGSIIEEVSSHWLSQNDECSWFGVTCFEDGSSKNVQQIFMENNDIAGTFPVEFALLPELALLDIPGNRLSGTLPPEISEFRSLEELRITNNEMTGELPDELFDLGSLVTLTIGGNDFSGTLSTKIGQLTGLLGLFIFDTLMDGPIPSEIGELRFLSESFLASLS
mmetsp:Transcript_2234/g.2898  ORF Transcript_2234/g.2898 Transcript_2234/m.2898 type:complete len:967 (-) Transcript_2234:1103-4003(-)